LKGLQTRAKKGRRPDSRLHASFGAAQPIQVATAPPATEVYWSPVKKVDLYSFDSDYLRRLKARDPATEAHFVSYFSPRMQVKLRHRGFSSPTLEDVSQETFFRVLTAVQGDNVLYPERFGAYVHSVCDRVILEKYREFVRNQHLDLDGMDVPDRKTNLEAMLLIKEKREIVEAILDELPAKKRNILRALIFEQLDRDELCRRFGVNSDYLRVLLFRAKEEFVKRFKARGLVGFEGGNEPQ
jgi:RNA polymerase sigma-70 factor, ECF subfamily